MSRSVDDVSTKGIGGADRIIESNESRFFLKTHLLKTFADGHDGHRPLSVRPS